MKFYISLSLCLLFHLLQPDIVLSQPGFGKESVSNATAYRAIDSLNELAFKIKRNDVDQALMLLHKASVLAKSQGYKRGETTNYLYEAGIFQQYGYAEKALSLYYKSLEISRETKDTFNIARANQQIGNALMGGGNLARAETLFKKAKNNYILLNHHDDVVNMNNSLGLLYMAQKNFASAEQHFTEALLESENNGYMYGFKKANFHLGSLYIEKNDLAKAKAYLHKALALDEESNDRYGLSLAKNKLSLIAGKEGDYEKAVILAKAALQDAEAIAASKLIVEAIENLAAFYKTQENYTEIIKWQDALIKQQLEESEKERAFALNFLEILEEKQASQLKFEKQVLQAEQKAEQMLLILEVVGVALILLLLLAYMWYLSYIKVKNYSKELATKNEMIEKSALVLDSLNKSILKQNESLEAANGMKGKLFSIISHDLRGPIASVKGVLSLIGRKPMPEPELRRVLGMMTKEVDVVMDLLNNLLGWSKAQLKGSVLTIEPLDLCQLTAENIKVTQREAQQKEINLVNAVPQGIVAMADRERLNFILRNLLINAIKFTFEGGQVQVHFEDMVEATAIVVSDNGQGISPENIEKLFSDKRFTTTGTAKEKGTGLGLMFSKDFIESLGGSIKVKSKEGEGSAFYVCLPKGMVAKVEENTSELVME